MHQAFTLLQIAAGLLIVALAIRRAKFEWLPGIDSPEAKVHIRRYVLIGLFAASGVLGAIGAVLLYRVFTA